MPAPLQLHVDADAAHGRFVRRIRSLTNRISRFNVGLGSASGLSTMMLMLIIVPDVMARKFLGFTIPFASEIAVLLLVCKIFLGLPGAQATKANFHVTLISGMLSPAHARILKSVTLLLSLGLIGLLSWYATNEAVRSTGAREAVYVGANQFPVWPQRIVVSAGLLLLALQLVMDLVRAVIGLPEAEVRKEAIDYAREAADARSTAEAQLREQAIPARSPPP